MTDHCSLENRLLFAIPKSEQSLGISPRITLAVKSYPSEVLISLCP